MQNVEGLVHTSDFVTNGFPVGKMGGRRHQKLKMVTRKKARKVLRKLGLKMRGGEDDKDKMTAPAMGGKRGKTHRRR